MVRRIAFALWIAWAVLLWNVVFDHVIVVAGREYIAAAERAFAHGAYENMDVWMRPAVTRAFWIASGSAAAVFAAGALLARLAVSSPGAAFRRRPIARG
jgi:hypothetical protein